MCVTNILVFCAAHVVSIESRPLFLTRTSSVFCVDFLRYSLKANAAMYCTLGHAHSFANAPQSDADADTDADSAL
jgi:hypothetical protein